MSNIWEAERFQQTLVKPENRHKTAFSTITGPFEFMRMLKKRTSILPANDE